MSDNITMLDYQNKKIILIATAHVSRESAVLVKQIIEEEHPDSVCIELDENRYNNIQNPKAWENTDIVKVIKSKKVGYLLATLALSSYQKRVAKHLNALAGGEMIQGIESAKQIGATVVLADRDIQTTFLRIWRKLNIFEKAKLLFSFVFSFSQDNEISNQDLQEMLQSDMLEAALTTMRKQFPKIGDILISERDQFLALKIKEAPGEKIVAVLGGAHVPGVKAEIYRQQDLDSISSVPRKNSITKIVGWLVPIIMIALLIYAFVSNVQTGLEQLTSWVLWTGVIAAFFTAVSFAHPLSIITSLIAAPFTTLNPILACGWFTGLVEATIRKPTVHDVHNVHQDFFSFKGFYRNGFLRILLVVFLANIGASIGTFIAGADIIRNLFY